MASRPRCPAPSGSNGEVPIGSCTTASEANRLSQASRSFAGTAARAHAPSQSFRPWRCLLVPAAHAGTRLRCSVTRTGLKVEHVLAEVNAAGRETGTPDLVRRARHESG